MAWRVLLALSRVDREDEELLAEVRGCVEDLGGWASGRSLVAELHVLAELAERCGLADLSKQCRDEQVDRRDPIREVFLRNLKSRVGWVEKKVNCDYLTEVAYRRHAESHDPGSHFANEVASHFANILKVSRVEGTRFHAGRCLLKLLPLLSVPQLNELTVELLRSLELDAEAVTRYIPRFLGSVVAALPEQEFLEALEDIESNVRHGGETLQRLLLQTVGWVMLSIDVERLRGQALRRLIGVLLGALAESRTSTVNESFAQLAMVLERLSKDGPGDGRLREIHLTATKKLLSLITHRPGDRVRFFLVASALSHLERAVSRGGRGPRFPERPSVALIPGTFDPFTAAHQAIVAKALESADEALVQMDDYSWRKHALPRERREELAVMALASVPNAFLAPFRPPVNLASVAGLHRLQRLIGRRKLSVVVGSDVVVGASAYANARSPIWDLPHVVIVREGEETGAWEEKIDQFRQGVAVVSVPATLQGVSSTALRATLDRHEEPDALCHPLVSRTILERNLYVNYPAHKQVLAPPQQRVVVSNNASRLPQSMPPIAFYDLPTHGDDGKSRNRWSGVLMATDDNPEAALIWRVLSAAALPAVVGDVGLPLAGGQRLLGEGALIESIAGGSSPRALEHLFADVIAHWLDSGLLFALAPVPAEQRAGLREALSLVGAHRVPPSDPAANAPEWAVLRLAEPLLLVWDLESVLQPSYAASLPVRRALEENRHAMARFFANSRPGEALLHLQEEQLRRRVAEWARQRIAEAPSRRRLVLGLGRQFSRDIVGDTPTLAVDLERFLTWQGYEGGVHPRWGSPRLELQLAMAREISARAILLVPFLESAEPVLQVVAAARTVGLRIDEVLVGVTDAAARATLELQDIRHRCGVVVPGWRGILRESLVAPYLGGWSIVGRAPLAAGSLLPSLNDCLPYHYPHHLGLDEREALDFSTLALQLTRRLLLAVEEAFREAEGRLLSVHELGAVVRSPRCPPFPQGFVPPRERFPSELLAEDIEALARLHPESHAAHRGGRRGE
jgi:nicotinic acid mononucleotide adenylyltransferase